jgi:hypothetical protein
MRAVLLAALIVGAAGPSACRSGGDGVPNDGLAPNTARFTYGARRVEVPLTACGRDGDIVVLAGVEGATVVQAGVDLSPGGAERSGVTADLGAAEGILGAFGAEAPPGPAGEITGVRVAGDRVYVDGRWARLDGDLDVVPASADELVEGRMIARCPEDDPPTD